MKWLTGLISWVMGLMGVGTTTNTDEVVKIQAEAVRFCSFLPTVETVTQLMAVVVPVPGVGTATLIAKKICQAVTAANATSKIMGATPMVPMVDGVEILGEFIGKDK
jgi:hypothetical protein